MRRFATLILTAAVGLGLATTGEAAVVEWSGTLVVNVLTFGQFTHVGTGVATVNGSAGGIGHINTISWHHGLSFTGGNNVPETIPLTDPEDPSLYTLRATGLRLGGTNYSSAFQINGISGGPPLGSKNTGRPPGRMKLCIMFPGCGSYLPVPFGTNSNNAIGIGGLFTVQTFSKGSPYRFSVVATPWTIGLVTIRNVTTQTPNGGYTTYTKTIQGFAHGPASNTSTTAVISGVLQLVAPALAYTSMHVPPYYPRSHAWWFQVTLRFIPEPGLLLLLGAGVGGLLMLGRSRMRG